VTLAVLGEIVLKKEGEEEIWLLICIERLPFDGMVFVATAFQVKRLDEFSTKTTCPGWPVTAT
jgi:hypothetical protein